MKMRARTSYFVKLRLRAALKEKILLAFSKQNLECKMSDKALPIIVASLRRNLLQTIQNCKTAKQAWRKFQECYPTQTFMNYFWLLKTKLNTRYRDEMNMSNHVSKMKSQLTKLAAMGSLVDASMNAATLITSSIIRRSLSLWSLHCIYWCRTPRHRNMLLIYGWKERRFYIIRMLATSLRSSKTAKKQHLLCEW